jgi:hypothetical protein
VRLSLVKLLSSARFPTTASNCNLTLELDGLQIHLPIGANNLFDADGI